MSSASSSAGQVGDAAALVAALGSLVAADVSTCDRAGLAGLVSRSQRLRGFIDAVDVRIAARARDLAAEGAVESPDDVVANRGRRSRRDAAKASARATACAAVPGLHEALASGAVSGEHVDAVAGAAANLDDDGKAKLAELADNVVASATALPVEEFERECRTLVRILSGDGGHSRHQRLRQARKVRRWVDRQTGMCKTLLELDPEADAKLWTAIGAAVRQARADQQPGDDRSFDQVQADTVVDLVTGSRGVDRRVPEVSVLIDLDTLRHGDHPDSTCETSDGEPVDVDAVRRMGCDGDLIALLLDAYGHCRDLGRSTRLASREQRQALRAMYRGCAFPGCEVGFDRCEIHHVTWWDHHGLTDLDNLLPLCVIHHHLVHDGGWHLTLRPNRTITVHRPDGTAYFEGDTTNRRPRRTQSVVADVEPTERDGTRQRSGDPVTDLAANLVDAIEMAIAGTATRSPP